MQTVAPILSYAARDARDAPSARTPLRVVQFILALPALVVPFVAFAYSTSPLDCVRSFPLDFEDSILFVLACGFFASFPIVAWQARRLAWDVGPGRRERAALAVVALLATAPITLVLARIGMEVLEDLSQWDSPDWEMAIAAVVGPFVTGVTLAIVRWRRGCAVAAWETLLVTGYLAIAAYCLLALHDGPQLGYWLTLPACASFAIDWLRPRA